jgi:hypothetical protein
MRHTVRRSTTTILRLIKQQYRTYLLFFLTLLDSSLPGMRALLIERVLRLPAGAGLVDILYLRSSLSLELVSFVSLGTVMDHKHASLI